MSGPEANPPPQDQLLQEAATWFARMRGPEAESSRDEFEAWLRRGALHRQAYNRAAEIFAMGKMLSEDENASKPKPAKINDARSSTRFAWAGMIALFVLLTAGWLALQLLPSQEPTRDQIVENGAERPPQAQLLSTTAGQTRNLRFADGSLVTLEGDSRLEVRLGSSERSLHLRRGRARFEVFHEPRPFVVHAGGGRVIARGTVFEVDFSVNRRVMVRLISGAVDVTDPPSAAPEGPPPVTRHLQPGEIVSYAVLLDQGRRANVSSDANGTQSRAAAPQPTRDYDGITVADLVAAANRGSARPIRVADTAIGEPRVSGRFRIDDTVLLAERLALLFDLAVDRSHPDEIVLRARESEISSPPTP